MTVHLEFVADSLVAVVSLDSPPLNIFDLEMRDGLIEAIHAVRDVPDVRAMILRSTGRHFSAGADLREFGSAPSIFEARRIRWDRDPWGPLWDCPVPTIAALRGVAVGSGMEIAMLCDLRVAEPTTQLGLPETKLGMLPAAGGTQSLTRAIGPHAALPLVASAITIDAAEALARGVVSFVSDDADARAFELARWFASLDAKTVAATRRALRVAGDLPLEVGLIAEKRLAATLASLRR
ncbi:MAG: enoyl-CoA hydratase/isomerase family protein [Actinomycetota bacterium]|nr:enoyl-CoA hydratase/isomerase family protein [Actinomycetota bacterium]